jgi:hypothetical protein
MSTVNIVRVPGDYQVVAKAGGIILDVYNDGTLHPATSGAVTVYGDLNVVGNTTYISTTNTNVVDNILMLNSGETNGYVTGGYAGIAISRGSINTLTNAAALLYNDTASWSYDTITSATQGVWEFSVGDGIQLIPSAIKVDAIRVGSNNFLNLFGRENPNAVLNVKGTTDYEYNVLDDDDIPNKKYVDDKAYSGEEFTKKVRVGGTFIELNDPAVLFTDPQYHRVQARIFMALQTSTNVVFRLEDTDAEIQGLYLSDTNITVKSSRNSESIRITAYNTGTVEIASALSLANINPPAVKPFHTNVYSTSTIGGGGTGVYFVNTQQSDELVSRKRAIIYGLIF